MTRKLRTPAIVALLRHHGGISAIHTHPVTEFNRRTGAYDTTGWANTAVCCDGFQRRLTVTDERVLQSCEPVNATEEAP